MEQIKDMYKSTINTSATQKNMNKSVVQNNAEQTTFDISGQQEGQHIQYVGGQDYHSKTMEITPENIMSSIKEAFENFKKEGSTQKFIEDFNKKALMGWIALETMNMPAYADEPTIAPPGGTVSYTNFLTGVKEHLIEKVRIDPTGRTAEFINIDGIKG